MKEIDYQREICKLVRTAGGYARKWSNPDAPGVPDIIASHPRTGPFLAEVKLMRDVPEEFNRDVGLTTIQGVECAKFVAAGTWVLLLVVLELRAGGKLLVICPPVQGSKLSSAQVFGSDRDGHPSIPWKKGSIIDLVVVHQRRSMERLRDQARRVS